MRETANNEFFRKFSDMLSEASVNEDELSATLRITMSGAAFEDDSLELARILRDLAKKIENNGGVVSGDEWVIRDVNGNSVGEFTV